MQLPLLNFPNHQGCRELNLGLILICSVFFLQGVRSNTVNSCAAGNPCKNEGVCIATDQGPICDCTRTEFTGLFCQEGELNKNLRDMCRFIIFRKFLLFIIFSKDLNEKCYMTVLAAWKNLSIFSINW